MRFLKFRDAGLIKSGNKIKKIILLAGDVIMFEIYKIWIKQLTKREDITKFVHLKNFD